MLRASTRENGMRVWVLAMAAACVVVAGCGDKPVPPFASAPFSVARKGNVLSIPFSVQPGTDLSHSYMLAFKFIEPDVAGPLDLFWKRPRGAYLFLKVRLVFLHPSGAEEELELHNHSSDDEAVQSTLSRDKRLAYVTLQGFRIDTAYMEVVHFMAPRYGKYRFDVETVGDMAIFEPIVSWLTVEREYRHHK
jgi:hypothetical protein